MDQTSQMMMGIMIIFIIIITIKVIIMKAKVLYEQANPIAMFVRSEALYNMCEVTDITIELDLTKFYFVFSNIARIANAVQCHN